MIRARLARSWLRRRGGAVARPAFDPIVRRYRDAGARRGRREATFRRLGATGLAALLAVVSGCVTGNVQPVVEGRSATGLVYDAAGRGPAVVLIHGTNLDRRLWDNEFAWLARDHRVIRYDQRGQGDSPTPVSSFSNHGDLIALLDELGVERATLVGLSSGAQVALDVALTAPGRVERLVLVSPSLAGYAPEPLPDFLREIGSALETRDYDRVNDILLASPIMAVPARHQDRVRAMVEASARLWTIPYSLLELVSPPAVQRLAEIAAPTLILVGSEDIDAIAAQGDLLERQLPDATRATVPGGGHLLNLTSPDVFRERVDAFLAGGR